MECCVECRVCVRVSGEVWCGTWMYGCVVHLPYLCARLIQQSV